MVVRLRIPSAKRKPGRGRKRVPKRAVKITERNQDRTEDGRLIQGREASDIEWAAYVCLLSLGYTDDDIQFQVPINGGRNRVGGGQVLDFVIDLGGGRGGRVILDVRGRRYHGPTAGKSAADRWREIQAVSQPDQPRYVIVWEEEAHNWGRLRSKLIREIGPK